MNAEIEQRTGGLVLTGVRAGYGAEDVLHGLDLVVAPGCASFVVGPNGAGKTTLARVLAGLIPTEHGAVTLDGKSIVRMSPASRARSGLSLIPEGRQIFPKLSVHEQLYVATRVVARRKRREQFEKVYNLIPRLRELRGRIGGTLSGGEQQLLAIGRAIASEPRYVILDEPTMGLSPSATDIVTGVIGDLRDEGIGVLVLAQDLHLSRALDGETQVMVRGTWQMSWQPGGAPDHEEFLSAYFGYAK